MIEEIKALLHKLARDRGAAPNAERVVDDAMRLADEFPMAAIRDGIALLGRTPRRDGETAYPAWGTLHGTVTQKSISYKQNPGNLCGECNDGLIFENANGQPWNWRTGEKRYARSCPRCRENQNFDHPHARYRPQVA